MATRCNLCTGNKREGQVSQEQSRIDTVETPTIHVSVTEPPVLPMSDTSVDDFCNTPNCKYQLNPVLQSLNIFIFSTLKFSLFFNVCGQRFGTVF